MINKRKYGFYKTRSENGEAKWKTDNATQNNGNWYGRRQQSIIMVLKMFSTPSTINDELPPNKKQNLQ